MSEKISNQNEGEYYQYDESIINALTYLCSQVGGFKAKPPADRLAFLENLGLRQGIANRVVRSFEIKFDFPRPSPIPDPDEPPDKADPIRCPINWHPNVLTPVFYGREQIRISNGVDAPADMNIFYPTIVGIVDGAAFLQSCGPYPLIVFLHGDCHLGGQDHYEAWYHLPAQLARSGYIVVVPKLGVTQLNSPEQLTLAEDVVSWMRTNSRYMNQLASSTGVVGHSYGGLLAGRLATRIPVQAMVNLSGEWVEAVGQIDPYPLFVLNIPTLFFWSVGSIGDVDADLESSGLFGRLAFPRHQITFQDGSHWTYLPRAYREQCSGGPDLDDCELYKLLAADFTALFFGRYLPPPNTIFPAVIRSRLLKPEYELSLDQHFYAGAHLVGLASIEGSRNCSLTHTWQLSDASLGRLTLPRN